MGGSAIQTYTRTNHNIRVPQVRLIGADGSQIGIVSTRDALGIAQRSGMDLVEISPTAQPPVCKVIDFGKYKYELEKKDKQARKNSSATKVKEVKFHSTVEENDFQTKIRHTREFLSEGHRVKVSLMFRGREGAHQDLGFAVINRVLKECEDISSADRPPQAMGRFINVLLIAKPATAKGKS